MARRPILGPKVAMYAGGIMPIILKNRMVKNESHQPRKNKLGPRVPGVISVMPVKFLPRENVDTVKFALIQTEKLS